MSGPRFAGIPVEGPAATGGRFGGIPVDSENVAQVDKPAAFDPATAQRLQTPAADMTPGGAAGFDVRRTIRKGGEVLSQRDPDIDYYTGVDQALFRAGFSRMSNDDEKVNWLDQKVGKGNHGKDSFGAWFIQPKGLEKLGIKSPVPISVDEQRVTAQDAADWAGDLPAVAGSAALGLATSGAGFFAGVGATALGAAGGKAYDELVKILQGYNKKGPGAMAGELAGEAGAAAAGEGVFRAGARLLKGYAPGNSPERIKLAQEAIDVGLRPKTWQFLDEGQAPLLRRFQAVGEKILGDPVQKQNRMRLADMSDDLVSQAGQEIPGLGAKLTGTVKTAIDTNQLQIEYAKNRANAALDKSLADIQTTLGSKDPAVGATVAESIKTARRAFADASGELYGKIDEMVGVPFVPTASLKAQAEKIASQLPRTEDGRVIFTKPGEAHPLQDILALPENITITQAQRIRSMLGEGSLTRDLAAGVDKRDLALLKQASEGMFDDASNAVGIRRQVTELDGSGEMPVTRSKTVIDELPAGRAQAAIDALKDADAFYKKGIKKFDFPTIAAITRDARMSGAVDPERVIDYIIKPGYSADAARVKALVTEPVWNKVKREHFDGLIATSESLVNGETTIVGKRLYDKINGMGRTLDAVYGKDAAAIHQYAKELAARDGKLDPKGLTGNIAADLEQAATRQKELDAFLKDNYLAALARPGQEADQAVDFIFRPNSPQRILEAKKFYGDTSLEFQGLQHNAMQKLLSNFVEATDDPLVKLLNGKALRGELDRYGKNTLEAAFGVDLTKDLYKFTGLAELMTKKMWGAGGLVAASVALHPIGNIGKIIDMAFMARLLRTPGVIKWLSEGINPDTPVKKAAAALARVFSLTIALADDETGSATVNLPAEQPN